MAHNRVCACARPCGGGYTAQEKWNALSPVLVKKEG